MDIKLANKLKPREKVEFSYYLDTITITVTNRESVQVDADELYKILKMWKEKHFVCNCSGLNHWCTSGCLGNKHIK